MEALIKDRDEYLFNLAHFTTQIFRVRTGNMIMNCTEWAHIVPPTYRP